jgi:type IV secretory pathway TraG/TraD family ATPase VirD4
MDKPKSGSFSSTEILILGVFGVALLNKINPIYKVLLIVIAVILVALRIFWPQIRESLVYKVLHEYKDNLKVLNNLIIKNFLVDPDRNYILPVNPNCINFGHTTTVLPGDLVSVKSNLECSEKFLSKHCLVTGETGTGKTFSTLLPQVDHAVKNGEAVFFIDPKGDSELVHQMYSIAKKHGREKDFVLVSLGHPLSSSGYNPLGWGSREEVMEKIFASTDHSEVFYQKIWKMELSKTLNKLEGPVSFERIIKIFEQRLEEQKTRKRHKTEGYNSSLNDINVKNIEGLLADLENFNTDSLKRTFGSESGKTILDFYNEKKIVLFNLSSNKNKQIAKSLSNLITQDLLQLSSHLQSLFTKKQLDDQKLTIFIDEFVSILSPMYLDMVNKVRSANFRIVMATQTLSDLKEISDSFMQSILSNCHSKITLGFRNEKDAQIFSAILGTKKSYKKTKQIKGRGDSDTETGLGSNREVDLYKIHPNELKSLGQFEGFLITGFNNQTAEKIKFHFSIDITEYNLSADKAVSRRILKLDTEEDVSDTDVNSDLFIADNEIKTATVSESDSDDLDGGLA